MSLLIFDEYKKYLLNSQIQDSRSWKLKIDQMTSEPQMCIIVKLFHSDKNSAIGVFYPFGP